MMRAPHCPPVWSELTAALHLKKLSRRLDSSDKAKENSLGLIIFIYILGSSLARIYCFVDSWWILIQGNKDYAGCSRKKMSQKQNVQSEVITTDVTRQMKARKSYWNPGIQ